MILTLTRDRQQPQPYCTMGKLVAGYARFETVERPWVPHPGAACGEQGKSCIGVGMYELEPRYTEAKQHHWILNYPALGVYRYPQDIPAGVYARSLVLIHAANWAHELLGCIAPGMGRATTDGELGVTSSRAAMESLFEVLVGETHLQLEVA